MAHKTYNVYSKKNFLNRSGHHSDASILSSVQVITNDKWVSLSGTLRMRDCSKTIDLSIDMDNRDNYLNSLEKVRTLIKNLQGFEKGMITGYEKKQELKAKQKANAAASKGKKKKKVHSS